jgi:hypothetical protein
MTEEKRRRMADNVEMLKRNRREDPRTDEEIFESIERRKVYKEDIATKITFYTAITILLASIFTKTVFVLALGLVLVVLFIPEVFTAIAFWTMIILVLGWLSNKVNE